MSRRSIWISLFVVGPLVAVKLALHVYANTLPHYEFHRDEFLYFAMGENLRLFGMDFPPFIAILSEFVRGVFGDSLLAIRMAPALAGCLLVAIASYTAWILGGRVFAVGLAGLSVVCSILFLRSSNLFQPVVFDQVWWSLGLVALLKLGQTGDRKWWLWYGVFVGLGLLTKFSILIFATATLVAFIVTAERQWFATPWPWAAAAIALIIGAPSWIGQIVLGWPVLGQMDAIGVQFEEVTYAGFLIGQLQMQGGFVIAVVGVVALVAGGFGPKLRSAGLTAVAAFLILLLLHGKPYYVGPIYPVLFGAGAVVFERIAHEWIGPAIRWGAVAFLLAYGWMTLPLSLPILPPAEMERWLVDAGLQKAATTNVGNQERIPQDYADMLNWHEQVKAVAAAYHDLPESDQRKAVILGSNYGEAGAIDFYGPRYGLPGAIATVGTYWFFGPGSLPGDVLIAIGTEPGDLERYFEAVETAGTVSHPFAVREERDLSIRVARRTYSTLQEMWPSFEGNH